MIPKTSVLSFKMALTKMEHYCAYQDRCHAEVMEKMKNIGVLNSDKPLVLAELIKNGFLNEERFALNYAQGKFKTKKWGPNKIKQALQQKKIGEYLIKQALSSIQSLSLSETGKALMIKKLNNTSGSNIEKTWKVKQYMIRKGYSYDDVNNWLNELT